MTTTTSKLLKPCPFCGEHPHMRESDFDESVGCHCGASGPCEGTKEEAIAAWNCRAASAAPAEGRKPTGDEVSAIVRTTRNNSGPSDVTQADEYVVAGWIAALATTPTMSDADQRVRPLLKECSDLLRVISEGSAEEDLRQRIDAELERIDRAESTHAK